MTKTIERYEYLVDGKVINTTYEKEVAQFVLRENAQYDWFNIRVVEEEVSVDNHYYRHIPAIIPRGKREERYNKMKWTPYLATGIAEGFIEVESEKQIIEAYQYLVDSGLAWSLQGQFGRNANSLIEQGLVMLKCPTCEETRYIKNKGCIDTICPEFEIIMAI